jgi:hypothetical protein
MSKILQSPKIVSSLSSVSHQPKVKLLETLRRSKVKLRTRKLSQKFDTQLKKIKVKSKT